MRCIMRDLAQAMCDVTIAHLLFIVTVINACAHTSCVIDSSWTAANLSQQGSLRAPSPRVSPSPFTKGPFGPLHRGTLRVPSARSASRSLALLNKHSCVPTHNNGYDKDAVPLSFVVVITQGLLRIPFPRSSVSNIWISSW